MQFYMSFSKFYTESEKMLTIQRDVSLVEGRSVTVVFDRTIKQDSFKFLFN